MNESRRLRRLERKIKKGTTIVSGGGGGGGTGATDFLGLSDTPNAYTGEALKFVRVNAGETALEFATGGGGSGTGRILLNSSATSYSVTGTTNETLLNSFLIPANTVSANDLIYFTANYTKTGTAGTAFCNVYFNTSNNLTGTPIQVGRRDFTSTQLFLGFDRLIMVKSTTSQDVFGAATNTQTHLVNSTTAISTVAVDFTVDQYMIFTGDLSNSGDTCTLSGYLAEIIRA